MTLEEKLAKHAAQASAVLGRTIPSGDVAEWQFIADMRNARAHGVGFGWMQQVIEWEWQAKTPGAWGPEYFGVQMKELRDKIKNLQQRCEHEFVETLCGPDKVGEHCIHCDVDRDYSDSH